jgi:hypothetical protein
MRRGIVMAAVAAAGLAAASAAQAQDGFDYLASRQFSCRLDTPHAEAHFVQFAFGPGNTVTGKMGIAVWVDGTPYTQVYDVRGRTDRFDENTYKVYIENYTRVSSDPLPGDYIWHYRSLDEFTLYAANGYVLRGRHTTVSPLTANNVSTSATYDSRCSEHTPG